MSGVLLHATLYYSGFETGKPQLASELEAALSSRYADAWTLDTINVLEEPLRALEQNIIATPALVRHRPPPMRRILVSTSDPSQILATICADVEDGSVTGDAPISS